MTDISYTIQSMVKILANLPPIQINKNMFTTIKKDYHDCLILLWLEEKFNIFHENYLEFEEEIKKNYDFFIENQDDKSDCNDRMREYGIKKIITLNRRLANFLSSVRMYQDQALSNLSTLGGNELKNKFKIETSRQYDNTYEYQLMEFLRNYMQHQGLIIEKIIAIIPFNKKIGDSLWYFVELDYQKLKKIDKFENKIKKSTELDAECEWLNIIFLIRNYCNQLCEIHNYFRKITEGMCNAHITEIFSLITEKHEFMIPEKLAFSASKEPNQDFLLQTNYLEKLKNYRNKPVEIDSKQFYIGKRTFAVSAVLSVSNSAKCSIIYNQT